MKYLYVITLLLLFVFALSPNSASAQPTREKVEFDKALFEMKDLKSDIDAETVSLAQAAKTNLLKEDIDASVASLSYLKNSDNSRKLTAESRQLLINNLAAFFALKKKTVFTVELTIQLERVLLEIRAEKVKVDCNNQERNVTATARGPSGNADNQFEVMYALVTDYPNNPRRMNGGQLATVTDKVVAGLYYFWTQDPTVSTRRGEKKYQEVCREDVPISLPVPIP
jgi:hypothetical protein